jgi:preprotein translocase subunit Sec61beta
LHQPFQDVDMMVGSDMNAKNLKTGKNPNAPHRNARSLAPALMKYWEMQKPQKNKLDPQDIHARLILIIGITLAVTFLTVTIGIVYALIFVTQPIGAQAPNDAAFIDLLKTLAIFLTGSLGGVLAGNGLKSKDKPKNTD